MSFCEVLSKTMILLSLIVALVGLVGNATVLWFLGFQMPRNAFSVYILNLAGADFLCICFHIGLYFYSIFDIGFIPNEVPDFFIVVINFAYLCGLSILSSISLERCLSVLWPIWYRCQRPRHTSVVICTLLWVMSLVLSLLEGKECGFLFDLSHFHWCLIFDFITTAWLIILFVVLLVSSLALVITIFCGLHRIPVTRLYVAIVLTVLVFLLLGLPYGIYWFLLVWIEEFNYALPCSFHPVTLFLSCVNSCANPIIYFLVGAIRHHRFQRKSLKILLQQAMQDTPENEECIEMGSSERSREIKNSLEETKSCLDQS
ncbi:mas-related G-protein coupled receptor member X2-like [Rattus rattus]|uniref:mas-related G-protein coupled receptor member X2-like n=1 Tax=Rattus rattus TaxID=10117 RepID=UPI0013F33491|nr:mas-related G-protein coupled receptor member X2-like [Rattus rattus]